MGAAAILIESEHFRDQVKQMIGEIGPDRCRPFSRCSICNVGLERIDRETVKGRVPRYVYDHHRDFAVCPGCGRYYWQGTHWKRMIDDIEEMMEGMDDGDTEGGRGADDPSS